jgi:tetratricopeptide (TPR) repeat protein
VGDLLFLTVGRRMGLRRGTPAVAWYERGLELEGTDPEAAVAAYRRCIAGRPDFADAHNNLGRVLHDLGHLQRAEVCYRAALALHEDVALYWFNLGVVVEDRGRSGDAIGAYERALAIDPTLADAHFNLARLYELRGRRAGDDVLRRRAFRHLGQYRSLARAAR